MYDDDPPVAKVAAILLAVVVGGMFGGLAYEAYEFATNPKFEPPHFTQAGEPQKSDPAPRYIPYARDDDPAARPVVVPKLQVVHYANRVAVEPVVLNVRPAAPQLQPVVVTQVCVPVVVPQHRVQVFNVRR